MEKSTYKYLKALNYNLFGRFYVIIIIEIYGQDAPKPNIMLKFQVNNYDLKSIIINHLPLNISFNNAYAFHSF